MAANVIKSLSEDFVHCDICREPYNQPKMLPCLHSFCLQCLEQCVKDCHNQPFSCPTCRCNFDLPRSGINGLPHNFFLVRLMERLKEIYRLSNENDDYNCNICNNKNDIKFCLDCKLHVCTNCKETHDRFTKSSDHSFIPSDKLSDESYLQRVLSTQAPYCTSHKQEKISYYCTQCNQLACQVCAIVSHQGHKRLHEVERQVMSVKSKFRALLEESESVMSSELDKLKLIKRATNDIKGVVSKVGTKIDARYEEIVTKLRSDKEKLKGKLQMIEATRCAKLAFTEEAISNWLQTMENTQGMTRKLLEQSNSWEILEMEKKIANSMERLKRDTAKHDIFSIPTRVGIDFFPVKITVLNPDADDTRRRFSSENILQANFLGELKERRSSLIFENFERLNETLLENCNL